LPAEAISQSLWPQVGQDYQGFEIVEPLGRGALARVYLARETAMGGRPVVIKVSQHGGHEANLLGKLEHANIVVAYSVKEDEATGMTVICMPLLGTATGLDLLDKAFRDERPPSTAAIIGEAARSKRPEGLVKAESLREAYPFARRTYVEGVAWLGKELATGLEAAIGLGVAHRDVKPSNVLLAWSGRPMLLDFNLSAEADDAGQRVGGTLAYMAPERIQTLLDGLVLGADHVDPRPDIFSLGVVLYELLAGRLPVQPMDATGTDEASLRRWLESRSQPIAPPSHVNPQVDGPIDRIVLKCLAADPARRFASAAELAADLADYLGPRQSAARWVRRNRRGVLAGGLAATLALGGGLGWWFSLPPFYETEYAQGLALYNAGNYDAALVHFDNSVGWRQTAKGLFARGQTYYRLDKLEQAKADYLGAAELDNRGVIWFCAGCCSLKDDGAFAYFAEAERGRHNSAEVYCNLGILYRNTERPEGAIGSFKRSIDLNPRLQASQLELAATLENEVSKGRTNLLPEALLHIVEAERLGPVSRYLYFVATRLHATAGADSETSRRQAEAYYRLWIKHGGLPEMHQKDPVLSPLLSKLGPLDELRPATPPPDPPQGVLPPLDADLSHYPAR
jgi:tetratricopeptide (TPR) repeat protein